MVPGVGVEKVPPPDAHSLWSLATTWSPAEDTCNLLQCSSAKSKFVLIGIGSEQS